MQLISSSAHKFGTTDFRVNVGFSFNEWYHENLIQIFSIFIRKGTRKIEVNILLKIQIWRFVWANVYGDESVCVRKCAVALRFCVC